MLVASRKGSEDSVILNIKRYKYYDEENQITFFNAICDLNTLHLAHKNAKRGKSSYYEVQMVDSDPEYYLRAIQNILIYHEYEVSRYTVETRMENGKERVLYKLPYYPDRIIQWSILLVIGDILRKRFISTTFSSIPERGTLLCKEQVEYAIRHYPTDTKYCLKIDMKKYYESINHELLKQKYRRLFKDDELLWLIDLIIDSTNNGVGVPIGNFLSQYSGNLFLSDLDHLCKEQLGCKYYYRYMDDIVILNGDKEFLRNILEHIREWCEENKLCLKENYQIFPIDDRGLDFVGFRIFRDHTILRKRIVDNMRHKRDDVLNGKIKNINHIEGLYNSYMGFIKHTDAYVNLYDEYLKPIKGVIDNANNQQCTFSREA